MLGWPGHGRNLRDWRQKTRQGPRADREFSQVETRVPPHISQLPVEISGSLSGLIERATIDAALLDSEGGSRLSSLGGFLIRTESVASSKIERIDASIEDFARALIGIRANESATSMVAAIGALTGLVDIAGDRAIEVDDILRSHFSLMEHDSMESAEAGSLRTVQNWIGGSDYSPRGALYVPPQPELVPELMADLIEFLRRDDMPALAQAALAHAQFESIHPFVDGNGRIGRALVNATLRRRGVTRSTVIPIASAIVADRDRYFALLDSYREGETVALLELTARATSAASQEATLSAAALSTLPGTWREAVSPRSGSALDALLTLLVDQPVLSAGTASELTGASGASLYAAFERLEEEAILYEITDRKRDKVWAASDVLEELDRLNERIGMRVRTWSKARGE